MPAKKNPEKAASPADFEQALAELESIVQRLEQGQHPLAQSLGDFERGIQLARTCEQSLQAAEQMVEQLLQGAAGVTVKPFKAD